MKKLTPVLFVGLCAWSIGCDRGTIGGPKAPPAPDNKAPAVTSPKEGTFSLGVPNLSTKITQGESKNIKISLHRGKNFDQDVKLSFTNVPKGVTIEPADPAIKTSDTETTITVKAADDAAVGDHTISVSGQPATGAAATSEFTISIRKK
jgi:hypothetical protein